MKKFLKMTILFLFAFTLSLPAIAQDEGIIVDGLNAPRGISYDSAGNLWVVEAGQGGDLTAQLAFGPVGVGGTGALKIVEPDGDVEIVVQNLPSQGPAGSARGAQDVIVTDNAIWLLIGEAPESLPLSNSLIELDRENFRIQTHVDLFTFEANQNPDGDIISSNPTDFFVTEEGRFYIANAGCNCIQTWAEGEEVAAFATWTIDDNPVPTSVALGADGSVYVSFLTGFPFPEGESRIEQYSADGELINTIEGLTAVVDLMATNDGTLYAVEHGVFGDAGWSSGRVVAVDADGNISEVIGGLTRPWGITMTPDGGLVVVDDSISRNGRVIAVAIN